MALKDASELVLPAVAAAIDAIEDLEPADQGMVAIARHLARVIDEATPAKRAYCAHFVAPELMKALAELGCSPAARARIKGVKPVEHLESPLKRLKPVNL